MSSMPKPFSQADYQQRCNAHFTKLVKDSYVGIHDLSSISSKMTKSDSSEYDSQVLAGYSTRDSQLSSAYVVGDVVHILEIVVRPDVSISLLIAGAAKIANIERLRYTILLLLLIYVCIYYLLCWYDIYRFQEVLHTHEYTTSALPLSTTSDAHTSESCTSHVQLLTKRSRKLMESAGLGKHHSVTNSQNNSLLPTIEVEWDAIDIQVLYITTIYYIQMHNGIY
jgi:hypothetical protein